MRFGGPYYLKYFLYHKKKKRNKFKINNFKFYRFGNTIAVS